MTYGQFSEHILALCARHSCSETSGLRTVKRNRAVGGTDGSKHLVEKAEAGVAYARDIVPDRYTKPVVAAIIKDAAALGIQVIDEGDHLHCQAPFFGKRFDSAWG